MQLPSGEHKHAVGEQVAPGERMMHEQSNVSIRGIGWFMVWFVVILVVVHVLVWGIYMGVLGQWKGQSGTANSAVASQVPAEPPPPRLQPSPAHDTPPRVDVERMWADEKRLFADRNWVKDDKVVVPQQIVDQVLGAAGGRAPATRPTASVGN